MTGLTPMLADKVSLSFIVECPVSLACKVDGFVKSPSAALRCIPCPVKLKAAISRDMGYRSCLKTVTSNKENI